MPGYPCCCGPIDSGLCGTAEDPFNGVDPASMSASVTATFSEEAPTPPDLPCDHRTNGGTEYPCSNGDIDEAPVPYDSQPSSTQVEFSGPYPHSNIIGCSIGGFWLTRQFTNIDVEFACISRINEEEETEYGFRLVVVIWYGGGPSDFISRTEDYWNMTLQNGIAYAVSNVVVGDVVRNCRVDITAAILW